MRWWLCCLAAIGLLCSCKTVQTQVPPSETPRAGEAFPDEEPANLLAAYDLLVADFALVADGAVVSPEHRDWLQGRVFS